MLLLILTVRTWRSNYLFLFFLLTIHLISLILWGYIYGNLDFDYQQILQTNYNIQAELSSYILSMQYFRTTSCLLDLEEPI